MIFSPLAFFRPGSGQDAKEVFEEKGKVPFCQKLFGGHRNRGAGGRGRNVNKEACRRRMCAEEEEEDDATWENT